MITLLVTLVLAPPLTLLVAVALDAADAWLHPVR